MPALWRHRQVDLYEFKVNLGFVASYRSAKATETLFQENKKIEMFILKCSFHFRLHAMTISMHT